MSSDSSGTTAAPAHQGDVLVVTDVVRRFGDLVAVDGVSFRIAPGETYGLLGPNGAGKTTTISMVAGLLPADAGTITLLGRAVGPRHTDVKRHVGLVPQDLAIYPSSPPARTSCSSGGSRACGGGR